MIFAQGEPKFMINLTGSEEVPPVSTNATGAAEISTFDIASKSVSYTINVPNILWATAGHTHLGKQGENGPIAVTFFNYGSLRNGVVETVRLQLICLMGQ